MSVNFESIGRLSRIVISTIMGMNPCSQNCFEMVMSVETLTLTSRGSSNQKSE